MMTLIVIFGVATGVLLLIAAVSRSTRRHTPAGEHRDSSYMFGGGGTASYDSSGCSDGSSGSDGGGCGDGGGGGGGD